MIIGVSGTPGCGKTTFAKKLASIYQFEYIELTKFIKKHGLADEFDEVDQSLVVDTELLNKALIDKLKDNASYVIDGHLSHDLDCVEICLICTCELSILNKRLSERNYSAAKIRENLDSEIFQICYTECLERDLPTLKIDCSESLSSDDIKSLVDSFMTNSKE